MTHKRSEIEKIFDTFIQGEEYAAFSDTDWQVRAQNELFDFLAAAIPSEKQFEAKDLSLSVATSSEEKGFIMGFKYGVKLMKEVYSK